MKCVDSIRRFSLLHPPLALHLSEARRDVFLVCSVASVVKERINMTHSTENTWTVASHWLGLSALRPFWGHLGCSYQLYKSSLQRRNRSNRPPSSSPSPPRPRPRPKSLLPRLPFCVCLLLSPILNPEQHVNNNNALLTRQCDIPVQSSLAAVRCVIRAACVWFVCVATIGPRGRQLREKCYVVKNWSIVQSDLFKLWVFRMQSPLHRLLQDPSPLSLSQ